jgi:hypothetical protein
MVLYYDSISQTYSLQCKGDVEFLGPFVHAMLKLREYGFTKKQAREAAMRAMMNRGDGVDLENLKKMTTIQ